MESDTCLPFMTSYIHVFLLSFSLLLEHSYINFRKLFILFVYVLFLGFSLRVNLSTSPTCKVSLMRDGCASDILFTFF